MNLFIVCWSGGYEPPQYEVVDTVEAAAAVARDWWGQHAEGDTIDVLRLDVEARTIERVPAAELPAVDVPA